MIVKKIDELKLFRGKNNHVQYNPKCTNCTQNCKQSYRVQIWSCKDYRDHRKND